MGHPAEKDAPHPTLDVEVGDDYATALRRERQGYVDRGLNDRVAQVDAELERLGAPAVLDGDVVEITVGEAPVETATPAKPRRAKKD